MNRDEKMLVVLTPGFPANEVDTTCLPMQQNLIRSLKEIYPGLNIIILSFQYPYFKKKYTWFNTTVISFDGRNKGGLARLLLRRKLNATLKEINTTHKITGLLSFWYGECALTGKRFADKNNLKHFCWILGQDAGKENKYPHLIPPKSDELIALSDFLQDEFEIHHGARPQYVIPAGIDAKQFNPVIEKKDIDILAAGSLIELKQYAIFLEVVAGIKKTNTSCKSCTRGEWSGKRKAANTYYKIRIGSNRFTRR